MEKNIDIEMTVYVQNKPKNASSQPAIKPSVLERLGAPPPKVLHNIPPSAVQHEEKVFFVANYCCLFLFT